MSTATHTETRTAAECLKEIAHYASQHRQARYRVEDAPARSKALAESTVEAYAALIVETVAELVTLPADETAAALVDHFKRHA